MEKRQDGSQPGVLPDELMETVRGYQPSRILLTGIELDVFSIIARLDKGATALAVAKALNASPRGVETLLNALVAMDLLAKADEVYATKPDLSRFLVEGSVDDARMALRHHLNLWASWSTLTQCVLAGHTIRNQEMHDRGDEWTKPFIAAMHRNSSARALKVVQAVGAAGVKRLLDIGGGSGAYSIAFAKANPTLQAEVFDLPSVVPLANQYIADAKLADRVGTRSGDLRKDHFGEGYDLVFLSAICHMLSPEENQDLLRRIFACLAPAGRVVIQDHVMAESKTSPRAGALFAINMLVGTTGGSTYSEEEYAVWLKEAGFAKVQRLSLSGPNDLMIGQKVQ
jgi:predicted O-methyltransferase YrrM